MDRRDDLPPEDAFALEGLLRWYAAMGVDAALDDAPHDRFVAPPVPAPAVPRIVPESALTPARPVPAAPLAPRSAEALVADAEVLAAGAHDLDELARRWSAVPGSTLSASSSMIAPHLPDGASLMLIGGAPGEDDERAGAIFAGAGGRLLDAMLGAIGLDRAAVALAHVVPWRPPGNRAPTTLELSLCLPFCRRQIALARPAILVALGERAAQPLLGTRDPLGRLRGRWLSYEGEADTVRMLATFAPAFLLSQPLQKRRAWTDLLMVEAALEDLPPRRS